MKRREEREQKWKKKKRKKDGTGEKEAKADQFARERMKKTEERKERDARVREEGNHN